MEITTNIAMMKVMYAIAVIGAGCVGLMTLLSPKLASQYVFANATQVDAYLRILGALWLALGVGAGLGLFSPLKFSAVLLIQLIYKSVWVLVIAIPLFLNGNREPGLIFLSGLFTVWIIALMFAVPFQYLFKL